MKKFLILLLCICVVFMAFTACEGENGNDAQGNNDQNRSDQNSSEQNNAGSADNNGNTDNTDNTGNNGTNNTTGTGENEGGDPTDDSTPKTNEEKLALLFESERFLKLTEGEALSGAGIEMFMAWELLPDELSVENKYAFEDGKYSLEGVNVFNDTAIFSDASGEYVYVFFDFEHNSSSACFEGCASVEYSDGKLTVKAINVVKGFGSEDMAQVTYIFKLPKTLLSGDVSSFELTVENIEK